MEAGGERAAAAGSPGLGPWLALALAVLLAPALGRWLAPAGAADEAASAYQQRRVQVTLATGRVPSLDHVLAAPEVARVPWPAAFAGMLSLGLEFSLVRGEGDPALGGRGEAEVRRVLARVGPWTAGIGALLLGLAAALFVRLGPGRSWFAPVAVPWVPALAALAIALDGGTLLAARPGALDTAMAARGALAGCLALFFLALGARQHLDALAAGLAGGALLGLAALLWAPALLLALPVAVAFGLAAAWEPDAEGARARRRAGLLTLLAAAVVVLMPAEASVWNGVEPSSLLVLGRPGIGWLLALAGGLWVLDWAARAGLGQRAAAGWAFALVAAVAAFFPGLWPGLLACFDRSALPPEPLVRHLLAGPAGVRTMLAALLPMLGFFTLGLALRQRWPGLALLSIGALLLGVANWVPGSGGAVQPLSAPLGALLLVTVVLRVGQGWKLAIRGAGFAALLGLSLSNALPQLGSHSGPGAEVRAVAFDDLRSGLPSPGPWNAPEAAPDWGILVPVEHAPALALRARRPPIPWPVGERPSLGETARLAAAASARFLWVDGEHLELAPPELAGHVGPLGVRVSAGEDWGSFELLGRHATDDPARAHSLWRFHPAPSRPTLRPH